MTNEINGFRPRGLNTDNSPATNRTDAAVSGKGKPAAAPTASGPAAATDKVSLTDAAARLHELDAMLASAPEIDPTRVEALRQAISEGRYNVDNVHVADKLIDLERNLFGKPVR